jgi:hypothetical protein
MINGVKAYLTQGERETKFLISVLSLGLSMMADAMYTPIGGVVAF